MRKSSVILTAVVILITAAVLIPMLWSAWNQNQASNERSRLRHGNSEPVTQSKDRHPPKNEGYDKARMDKLIALVRLEDVPIKFYGIVVDQDETPLPNARVDWSITKPGYYSNPPDVKGTVSTDQAGRFAITGETGHFLDVDNIAKDGYRQARSSYYDYSYGLASGGPHVPDAKKPEVFVLVKNELPKVKYIKDKTFSLTWNSGSNRIPLGVNDLELLVSATRDKKPGQMRGFPWQVEFSIPNSELTEMDWNNTPLAPSIGYHKVFLLSDDATDSKRHVDISDRILVFRTKSGLFGRIRISISPESEKNALRVATYLNDYGKRNLE